MAVLRAQVILPFFTNLPSDVITNVTHWETDDSNPPAFEAALALIRLTDFYETAMTGYSANYVSWSAARLKVYDLADPTPRNPVYEQAMPLSVSPAASAIPTEVAAVLSYHAAPVSGIPAGRLRNRFYLGGLGPNAMGTSSTSTFPTLASTFRTTIATAAEDMLAANTAQLQWKCMSNATGLAITSDIVGGWVDNSPDTQRRRSVQATARLLWP